MGNRYAGTLHLTIHRGTREIGGSCVELCAGDSRLIIDLGQPIASELAALDGRKLSTEEALTSGLLPAIPGLYRNQDGPRPVAVVLSHLHQDHAGLIQHVHPDVPVYLGHKALTLYRAAGPLARFASIETVDARGYDGTSFELGPFQITPHLMDHSAFDAYGLEIEGGGRRVYYSGDFRGHGRKHRTFDRFCRHPPAPVDVLLMEGTTLGRPDRVSSTETDVEMQAATLLKDSDRPALAAFSPMNLDRLVSLYRAALRAGRRIYMDAYGALCIEQFRSLGVRLPRLGRKAGDIGVLLGGEPWLDRPEHLAFKCQLIESIASPFDRALAEKPLIACRFRLLSRLEKRTEAMRGGLLLYSQWSGYLPRDERLNAFVDRLGLTIHHVHTSGHADLATLKRMVEAVKSKVLVPIHTESAQDYEKHFWPVTVHTLVDGEEWRI